MPALFLNYLLLTVDVTHCGLHSLSSEEAHAMSTESNTAMIACAVPHWPPLWMRAVQTPDAWRRSLRRLASYLWPSVIAMSFVLSACGEPSARCNTPPATFRSAIVVADHLEVAVQFTCAGAVQVGTLYLSPGRDPHPAVV